MAACLLLGGPAPFGAKTLLTVGFLSGCRMLLILSFALGWRVGFYRPITPTNYHKLCRRQQVCLFSFDFFGKSL